MSPYRWHAVFPGPGPAPPPPPPRPRFIRQDVSLEVPVVRPVVFSQLQLSPSQRYYGFCKDDTLHLHVSRVNIPRRLRESRV